MVKPRRKQLSFLSRALFVLERFLKKRKYAAYLIIPLSSATFIFVCYFVLRIVERLDAEQENLVKKAHFEISGNLKKHSSLDTPRSRDLRPNDAYFVEPDSARSKYEQTLDSSIIEPTVERMRVPFRIETVDTSLPYDVHKCPSEIPEGYPHAWSILDVLQHWNPDDTQVPERIYQGLCTIDWRDPDQQEIASIYRQAELPFLIHHHPELWETAERWSHYDYMINLVGEESYKNEHSTNNHMMYWKLRGQQTGPEGWKPPTKIKGQSYKDWYSKAMGLESREDTASVEHFYFRLDAKTDDHWMYDELPFFRPQKSFFMVEPHEARGINCRFGSKGIIAETHYDASRNFILILKGRKRYILAHPNQCPNMELYPPNHPSGRHSRVNWSDPNDWQTGNFPKGEVNEVVLQAGDALYLPTHWFHFIVSLNMNYQCNARSGTTHENDRHIRTCGF